MEQRGAQAEFSESGRFVSAVVVAAGSGTRMGAQGGKLFLPLLGQPVLAHTLAAFERSRTVREVVVVGAESDCGRIGELAARYGFEKVARVVPGGKTRQESCAAGFAAADSRAEFVLFHDGARPLVTPEIIDGVARQAFAAGAAAAAVRVKDTVKIADEKNFVRETPDRSSLWAVQTPQAFSVPLYRRALAYAAAKGLREVTDDCQLVEALGERVLLVESDYANLKLTTPEDIPAAEAVLRGKTAPGAPRAEPAFLPAGTLRVGHGYDAHRFEPGRRLVLGGVEIPWKLGLAGHSDADAPAHAVIDALLGAAGLGDIGGMFPDTDPAFEGADSIGLLRQAAARVRARGLRVGNLDVTVVAQAPRLAPYIGRMRRNFADACGVLEDAVNVKATTEEHMGFTGRLEGIAAHAVALLEAKG